MTRAEHIAVFAEREVGFLKALNVSSRYPLECFVVLFPSGMLVHRPRIGELREQRSCTGLWQRDPWQRATHQRKKLENLVDE